MRSQKENQALFEEALALREAMKNLIHSQVTNKNIDLNENIISKSEKKEGKRIDNASA